MTEKTSSIMDMYDDYERCVMCDASIKDCQCLVSCDEDCEAKQNPKTVKELFDAYNHWNCHGDLGGCSHGC